MVSLNSNFATYSLSTQNITSIISHAAYAKNIAVINLYGSASYAFSGITKIGVTSKKPSYQVTFPIMVLTEASIFYAMTIGFINNAGEIYAIGSIPSGYAVHFNISFVI